MEEFLSYDGTFRGFLSLLYYLLNTPNLLLEKKIKIFNQRLHKEFLFSPKEVFLDLKVIKEFYLSLEKTLSQELFKKLFLYYLCDTANLELLVARVIHKTLRFPNYYKNLSKEEVIKLYQTEKAFYRERHRYYGLLRFISLPDKTLVAQFNPKFNILPKMYSFFVKRFPQENFLIFDRTRNLVFIYKNQQKYLFWVEGLEIELKEEIDPLVNLWKTYFKEIAIPERINFNRQRNRLPLRYRNFLPEFDNP